MTTPAPDEHGRPAFKRTRGKIASDTRPRWLEGGRQWAPWRYDVDSLLTDPEGNLVVPTVEIKECLHQLPRGHTNVDGISSRSRHRMLGNSWHVGVAQFLILSVARTCTKIMMRMRCLHGVLPPKPLILFLPEAFWLGVRTLSCKIVTEEWLLWKWCPHRVLLSKGWLFTWGETSYICGVSMRGCDFTRQVCIEEHSTVDELKSYRCILWAPDWVWNVVASPICKVLQLKRGCWNQIMGSALSTEYSRC